MTRMPEVLSAIIRVIRGNVFTLSPPPMLNELQ